jgi:DNA-3-methyladenine glycosylase II
MQAIGPSAMTAHFKSQIFKNQDDLETAMRALVVQDERLAPVLAASGMPTLRQRAPGFAGLASVICGQQLSTFAAAAIWARVVAAYDDPAHHHFRAARPDKLRRLGLSNAKIKTLKFIANEIHHGRLDLARIADAPADEAHNMLTALHGIGPWTADIYLLFCMGNADAWPAGDLALQEAVRVVLGLKARPTVKEMAEIGEAWRPWRGAAAHLFWAYYRVTKRAGFSAAPPDAETKLSANGTKTTTKKAGRRTPLKKAVARKATTKRTTKTREKNGRRA